MSKGSKDRTADHKKYRESKLWDKKKVPTLGEYADKIIDKMRKNMKEKKK